MEIEGVYSIQNVLKFQIFFPESWLFLSLVADSNEQDQAALRRQRQEDQELKASLGYGWNHVSKCEKLKRKQ